MRVAGVVFVMSLALAAAATQVATGASQQPRQEAAAMRVGAFDSRAVAVAYARSEAFRRGLTAMRAEYDAAKETGDAARVAELDAEGTAMQDLLHRQAFSTWPVDDILEQIENQIPGIAERAGVDLIVSKWTIVYQRPGIEFVDLTDLMVVPFEPDEETLKIIEELKKQAPVPLEEFTKH